MAVVADEVARGGGDLVVEQRDGRLGDDGPVAEDTQAALVRQKVGDGLGEGVGEEAGGEVAGEGNRPAQRGGQRGEAGGAEETAAVGGGAIHEVRIVDGDARWRGGGLQVSNGRCRRTP